MDGGGSVKSSEEKEAEKLMDDYLKSIGLHRKRIAKDGSCLFRAVAEQVLHSQSHHTRVRAKCVEFLQKNRGLYEAFIEGDFDNYLCKLQNPQQWVGEVEINALAVMYKRDFLIFQEPGKPAVNITGNNFKDKVQLCFMNGNHYDSVYPISHFKNAALCQSVLYELLYDSVFKVDRSLLGSCQRVSRPGDVLSDDNMATCGSSDESGPDTGEALWVESETTTVTRHYRGRGRRGPLLPKRVRRSLNPTLFRNIEYDVWNKNKRAQQKMDYCIAAGMQFAVGDRCQVRLDGSGRSYSATVKEVSPNNGPVTVYTEELGRKQVPLWSLRPPSNENSWSTVASRDKRLSNGHGEWEERGKGRGRGKLVPGSSSVSQMATVSSSGRVQKQHSWTQQASVEEQGGVKHSRKSVSSVEPAFGLTEEQRLAKEEEEMNVALVEIQLRDEHSFPALGTQPEMPTDGGRKKGGEKAKSQRNKMKSPVEDVIAPSPSAGERPRSSTPPLADAPATTAPTTNAAAPTDSIIPAAPSTNTDSTPADPDVAPSALTSDPPLTSAAPIAKTNAPSLPATSSSPPAATAAQRTKPPILGGAAPSAGFPLLTPVLPTASSASVPNAHYSSSPPPSSFCSLVPQSSASTPPSSLPPPTFISPIAPSPTAAQSFLPSSSLPRCSPPVPSLPHSLYSSSSSLKSDTVHVQEGPVSTQTPNIEGTPVASQTFQSQASQSQILPKGSLPQGQNQTLNHNQPCLPQNQTMMPQMRAERESSAPHDEPQLHTEVASLPECCPPSVSSAQTSVPHLQPQHVPQSPAAADQVQASHPAPETSLETSQASGPAPLVPQPSVTQPQPHVHLERPPHPSQVPHPSLSQSVSHTYPPPHSQTSSTYNQSEASLPSSQMQPESPAHGAFQQQPHLSHPHLQTMFAHIHPQPIPGTVPLQQLPQLYQDLLYPGFPLGEKGTVAPTPSYSSSKSGDDLPQEINILRFFFNLGVKAYSMPMIAPYFYLCLLQHAHTMQSQVHSSCARPAPHYPTSKPPTQHQEAYSHPPYPSSPSVPPQYDQPPLTESAQPIDTYSQASYTVTEPLPHHITGPMLQWQQPHLPPPTSASFPVGFPAPYSIPQHFPQCYHPSQVPGLPRYPSGLPSHPLPSLGYQSSSAPEELQVNQGTIDQLQPANGDTPGRLPAAVTTNITTANNNKTVMVPSYAVKTESRENLTRAVLLVDPPLDNKPILISNSGIKDVPVSRATMKTGGNFGCPLPDIISKTTGPGDSSQFCSYRGHQKVLFNASTFSSLGVPEHSQGHLAAMAEPSSVGCNTEDNWEEEVEFRKSPSHHRGSRRNYRGGFRGRGHDSGRGTNRRRQGGDAGAGIRYSQNGSSYQGRGKERGH